jgi:Domain of unknown function (DUF4278)
MRLNSFFQPHHGAARSPDSTSSETITLTYRGASYQRPSRPQCQPVVASAQTLGKRLIYRGATYHITALPSLVSTPQRRHQGASLKYRGATYTISAS